MRREDASWVWVHQWHNAYQISGAVRCECLEVGTIDPDEAAIPARTTPMFTTK